MNKNIIGIIVVVLVLVGIIWIARPNSQTNSAASLIQNSDGTLTAEEISFDFGSISMAAGEVRHSFPIKNTGAEPIAINKMYTSCMCTTATLISGSKKIGPYGMPGHAFVPKINEVINSGDEAIVEVVFDPAAHGPAGVGRIQRIVTIENNAGQPLNLEFSALVTP